MASRIMHLAIAKNLVDLNLIDNIRRYEIGQILPDAISQGTSNHNDSHFKLIVYDGKKKMMDFAEFYNEFNYEIHHDDLYLGYYMHLVQDGIYRKFLNDGYNFKISCKEDIDDLHNDYKLLNTYLISKYRLKNHLQKPEDFDMEKINRIYKFAMDTLLEDVNTDFLPYHEGKTRYFTDEMADQYVELCSELCNKELEGLRVGRSCLNPIDYAWDIS